MSTSALRSTPRAQRHGQCQDADPRAHGKLFAAVMDLYRKRGDTLSPGERAMMSDILGRLTRQVELSLRQALAETLAEDAGAPLDVILLLANDEIEIARPVLEKSPVLGASDLASLARALGEAHQMAIARRENLPAEPALVLAQNGIAAVLLVLLQNASAQIPDEAFRLIARKAAEHEQLQEPLVRRDDLPGEIAARLAGVVSGRLREHLLASGKLSADQVDHALARIAPTPSAEAPVFAGDAKAAERLVEKLHAAGQLRPGFLIKALNAHQMSLFEYGLAKLAGLTHAQARRLLYELDPVPLATVCRALNLDRAVFRAVMRVVMMEPSYAAGPCNPEDVRIDAVFETLSPGEAYEQVQRTYAA